jgi:hypothetical protein
MERRAMSDQLAEISLKIELLERRIDEQERVIKSLQKDEFVTIPELSKRCGLSVWQIRAKVRAAHHRPADNEYGLENGKHYLWPSPGRQGGKILVNPTLFLGAIGIKG